MQYRHLLLLALFLASNFTFASNLSTVSAAIRASIIVGDSCELPAPETFEATEIGTDWVKYEWTTFNSLDQHRIRTYRSSDDMLLNTTIVPGGINEAIVGNLPSETDLYGVINTICPDGSNSEEILIIEYRTVILDLVALAFTEGSTAICTLNVSNYQNLSCDFPNDGTYTTFRIKRGTVDERQFSVAQVVENNEVRFKIKIGTQLNGGSPKFKFYCLSSNPECSAMAMTITWISPMGETNSPIAMVTCTQGPKTESYLHCSLSGTPYSIEKLALARPSEPSSGFIRQRDSAVDDQSIPKAYTLNPFSDNLNVYLPKYTAEQISLQLYNLSGQKVLDQQFPAGQDQYTLSTEKLQPGFYLLRIEADGEVQTLKVIKSE